MAALAVNFNVEPTHPLDARNNAYICLAPEGRKNAIYDPCPYQKLWPPQKFLLFAQAIRNRHRRKRLVSSRGLHP